MLSDTIVQEGTSPLQHISFKKVGKNQNYQLMSCVKTVLNEEPVKDTNTESIRQIIKHSYSNLGLQCWEGPHLQDGTIDDATKK